MMRFIAVVVFFVLGLAGSAAMRAQSDPFIGTWKLNLEKSKFDPGPPLKSETRIHKPGEAHIQRVNGDGTTQAYDYKIKYDGKDYPITGQGPNGADALAAKSIDPNTVQATLKKSGKVLFTNRAVVSKNGKVMTFTAKGVNASGKPFNNVQVYDKQ